MWAAHRNVKLRFAYDFLTYLSQGIWSVAILTNYLTALTSDVQWVGYVEGMQGICMALISLPAGYVADKFGHKWVLRSSRAVGVGAVFLGVAGVVLQGPREFLLVSSSLVMWGVYFGLANPALDADFANSTYAG